MPIRPRGFGFVAAACLLLADFALADQPAALCDTWKMDVVYLKGGRTVSGLLLKETPTSIYFLPVHRNPGEPTWIASEPANYLLATVEHIDRLNPDDRQFFSKRIAALKAAAGIEEQRTWAIPLASVPWKSQPDRGLTCMAGKFKIVSDADEKTVRRVAFRLEEISKVFSQFLKPRLANAKPIPLYLYASLAELHADLAERGNDVRNPALYDAEARQVLCSCDLPRLEKERDAKLKECKETLERLKSQEAQWWRIYPDRLPQDYVDRLGRDRHKVEVAENDIKARYLRGVHQFYKLLYHEACHAYLANDVYPPTEANLPSWLNEGLAQIFEDAIVESGDLRVRHVNEVRLFQVRRALFRHELIAIADLLASGPDDFLVAHGNDERISNAYYLTSWAVAFYIMFELNKIGTPELDTYFQALERPDANPQAEFARFVGRPISEFEKELHLYLRHLGADGSRH
jgi:hypothetical protein